MTQNARLDAAPAFSWLTAYGRVRWWVGAFAAWTVFGALVAAHYQVRLRVSPLDTLMGVVPYYWAWTPVTPFVIAFTRRFGAARASVSRTVAGLMAGAAAAVVLHIAVYSLGFAILTGPLSGMAANFAGTLMRHGIGDIATCAALIGGLIAVHQHQRALARERDASAAALQASRLAAQLSEARLAALRMQLQPHFLFNALNSVSVLVLKGAGDAAIRAVRQLADLLRVTLHACDTPELPLSEETEFALRYLQLEQLRFGDRLRVECAVEPGIEHALVPSLILQPLVENAVTHGLRARPGGGLVRITAHRDDGILRLDVSDDGAGLSAGGTTPDGGRGLANTRARLRERYGDAARLSVQPVATGGTSATIELPWRTGDAGGES